MNSLLTLWSISVIIAGVALAIMVGLLLARLLSGWARKGRETERRRLVPLLLGGLPSAPLGRFGKKALVTDLSVELIRLVRGSDRDRFVETASRIGVPDRLRHRIGSGSARVRLGAAEALAEFGDERSIDCLNDLLGDRSSDVRLSAALALAEIRRAPPVAELVARLGIGTEEHSLLINPLFREIAQQRPEEIRALILDDDAPAGAKAAAVDSLSASGDYALVPLVADLAQNAPADDPALPRYLRALGAFGHPAGRHAIAHGLASPAWEARAAAAEAAGRIELVRLAPALGERLGDESFWVRLRAGEALVRLGAPGIDTLREAASLPIEPARTAAAMMLAERGLA